VEGGQAAHGRRVFLWLRRGCTGLPFHCWGVAPLRAATWFQERQGRMSRSSRHEPRSGDVTVAAFTVKPSPGRPLQRCGPARAAQRRRTQHGSGRMWKCGDRMNDDLMRLPETMALSRRHFTVLGRTSPWRLGFKAISWCSRWWGLAPSIGEAVFCRHGHQTAGDSCTQLKNSPDRPTIHDRVGIGAECWPSCAAAAPAKALPFQEWMGLLGAPHIETPARLVDP